MQKSDNKPVPLPIPRGRKVRLYTNLCMTITVTKIAVVVPIPDKVATIGFTDSQPLSKYTPMGAKNL